MKVIKVQEEKSQSRMEEVAPQTLTIEELILRHNSAEENGLCGGLRLLSKIIAEGNPYLNYQAK
jgi:hypothetical protein